MESAIRIQYVEWLSRYRWRLVCVFTLRRGRTAKTGKRLLKQWLEDMQRSEGRPLSWIVRPERGPEGHLHFHVLIAGITTRVYTHAKQWSRSAGYAHILRFKRLKRSGRERRDDDRGVNYVLKGLEDDDYDIEIQLHDRHLLPRFKALDAQTASSSVAGLR
jgi:hypothetical protein